MFSELMESQPRRTRNVPQTLVSIAVHTAVIAVSIQLTRAVAHDVAPHIPEREMLLTPAPAPPPPHAAAASAASAVVAAPPAPALPAAPISVPTAIPPIAAGPAIDPRRLGFDRGLATRPGDTSAAPGGIITGAMADDPAEYLDGPPPLYPPALRQVGVAGSVTLRYVVGADGRVEPASIAVIDSSNAAFNAAAIQAILAARFRPARLHGHAARQLVQQVIRFTLTP